ncbi:MAG: ParA family protein, partial [Pseudomonadota bacterium]
MSRIIVIAQRKGGAGKTTLACQLTSALLKTGASVVGVDADEQQSFTQWGARRAQRLGDEPAFLGVAPERFGWTTAHHHASNAPDFIVVDTPPRVDGAVRRALRAADLVLTPMQLSPIDLEAS